MVRFIYNYRVLKKIIMTNIHRVILYILAGVISIYSIDVSAKSKVKVNVVKASELNNATVNVVPYFLPKTVIRVDVEIEKEINKVGPFYRYSEKFLNLTDVITENTVNYSIKSIKMSVVGKPDFDRSYLVQMEGDGVAQNLNLTPQGILCGINLTENKFSEENTDMEYDKEQLGIDDVNFDGVPMLEKLLVKTSTASMAEEAANYIYKIRKRKMKILASDFENLPPDGVAYQIVDKELDVLEQQFVELFSGKKVTQTMIRTIEYTPYLQGSDQNVLFRFSDKGGILDSKDLSGTPFYIEITNHNEPVFPDNELEKSDMVKSKGLFYCLPAMVTAKIIDRNITILEKELRIAQFGQILSLPPSILERKDAQIELSPVTGAILNIR